QKKGLPRPRGHRSNIPIKPGGPRLGSSLPAAGGYRGEDLQESLIETHTGILGLRQRRRVLDQGFQQLLHIRIATGLRARQGPCKSSQMRDVRADNTCYRHGRRPYDAQTLAAAFVLAILYGE